MPERDRSSDVICRHQGGIAGEIRKRKDQITDLKNEKKEFLERINVKFLSNLAPEILEAIRQILILNIKAFNLSGKEKLKIIGEVAQLKKTSPEADKLAALLIQEVRKNSSPNGTPTNADYQKALEAIEKIQDLQEMEKDLRHKIRKTHKDSAAILEGILQDYNPNYYNPLTKEKKTPAPKTP